MQDIVPRKSIREIEKPTPQNGKPRFGDVGKTIQHEDRPEFFESTTPLVKKSLTRRLFLPITIFILFLGFVVSTYIFPSATIYVKPYSQLIDIPTNDLTLESGTFEITEQIKTAEKTIAKTGTREVAKKATGEVVLYNAFSSAPQTLVTNTRLSTPDGKVYRLTKGVTIPGLVQTDSKTVPGSISVSVSADKAGDVYNLKTADFTIVAYAGTTKGEKIYARTKTPITGGFIGTEAILNEKDVIRAKEDLQKELGDSFDMATTSTTKEGFLTSDTLRTIAFESEVVGETVRMTAKERYVLLNIEALSKAFAKITNDQKLLAYPLSLESKTLSFSSKTNLITVESTTPLLLSVSGQVLLTVRVDSSVITKALDRKEKQAFVSIMQNFPHLREVSFKVFPFWIQHFPHSERITVTTE